MTAHPAPEGLPRKNVGPSRDEQRLSLDRRTLASLLDPAEPHQVGLDRIQRAVDRADYDDAACRALARLKLGLPVSGALAAEMLVGVRSADVLLVLGQCAGGEIIEPLLELLRRARFGDGPVGAAQLLYVALILEHLGALDVARSTLLPRLRSLARGRWRRTR